MADLRGGSTVGGIPIVTIDMIENLLSNNFVAKNHIKQIINSSEWTLDKTNGLYTITVEHSLGSEDIISIIYTNQEKMSMMTAFKTLNTNNVQIWCSENGIGKIITNVAK